MSISVYNNVTISGLPGAGSTTLLDGLKQELEPQGWKAYSGGAFMRAYAEEKGLLDDEGMLHHSANAYDDDFDREVDYGMREKLASQKHWILESWLSGFMAQQVPKVCKILLVCSDKSVRVDRVVNRDSVSPEQAIKNMNKRYQVNMDKWRRMYKEEWSKWVVENGRAKSSDPIDFWREDLYDIVIDTYTTNKEATLERVLHEITKKE